MFRKNQVLAVLVVASMLLGAGAVRAADSGVTAAEGETQAKKEKEAKKGIFWGFLWEPKTIEKKLGEALTEEQTKQISAAREEIKKKNREALKGGEQADAAAPQPDPQTTYKNALKEILSEAQFAKLFSKPESQSKKTKKQEPEKKM